MVCPIPKSTPREIFLSSICSSLSESTFVKITFGDKRAGEKDLKNIFAKRIRIKSGEYLSFTYRYATKDIVKNYPFDEAISMIDGWIWAQFFRAELFMTTRNLLVLSDTKGNLKLKRTGATETSAPSLTHDKIKTRYVETKGNIYLRELGVTDEKDQVLPSMQDKFKQINKFVEIIESLVTEAKLTGDVTVADMWSGKGYLTFATYDYLSKIFSIQPKVEGIEYRKELVDLCNSIARKSNFDHLHFRAGAIGEIEFPSLQMLIALHACDTATDDAIYQGIVSGAKIIICSPCCHKEIRRQIRTTEVMPAILKHGILEERQAEMVTDGLRALLMEACGYTTKVFEFISSDHTGKNLMITGVKKEGKVKQSEILGKIQEIKQFFGIKEQRLEKLLHEKGQI